MADLIRRVADEALRQAEIVVPQWLPGGAKRGSNWVCGNLQGSAGESLVVNLHDGGWKDYADQSSKGGDLVSLFAAIRGLKQGEAAQLLADELRLDTTASRPASTADRPSKDVKSDDVAEDGWRRIPGPVNMQVAPILVDRSGRVAAKHWVYRAADGRQLQVVVRWDTAGDKIIRPFTVWASPDGTSMEWRPKGPGKPRPVYNADLVTKNPDATVIVCEGEKAADAAAKLLPRCVAVTSGGAQTGATADWSCLAGRTVVLWPDYDQVGADYARTVAKALELLPAAKIGVVDWEALAKQLHITIKPKDDAADIPAAAAIKLDAAITWIFAAKTDTPPEAPGGAPPSGDPHAVLIAAIQTYLNDRGLAPDALDGWRNAKGWGLVREDISALCMDFIFGYRHIESRLALSRVQETLEAMTRRARVARRKDILGHMTGTPATEAGEHALRTWVRAVCGDDPARPGEPTDLDLAVVRHWLWLTKRQALGMATEHDLMPVIFGLQGSGKTTAVEILTKPFAELSLEVDSSYLTDDRRSPVLAAAVIGRWEEMQGSARADLEALKRTITSPTISYRPMRTNATVVLPRTCVFIGTTNLPVDAIVMDTTGNRRFVQLTTPTRCDWDLLSSIDPVEIWHSVSERDAAPILPHLSVLRVHQAAHIHKDPVALWLESEDWGHLVLERADSHQPLIVEAYNNDFGESFEYLAARFQHWCKTVGQTVIGAKTLALRLRQEGFEQRQVRRLNGTRPRVYFRPHQLDPASVVEVTNAAGW